MQEQRTDKSAIFSSGQKIRDFYARKPDAPLYKKEFGFYVLDKWVQQGYLKPAGSVPDYDAYLREVFGFDEPAIHSISGLGWCEAGFFPAFEEKILEDRGEYELVQDSAGRGVLYFKGRRQGFMPEYVDHPVKDWKTWERDVKWRLDPHTDGRLETQMPAIRSALEGQKKGHAVVQQTVGGYMYLRSLMGPEDLLYMFYDDPKLIHDCMQTWFTLADTVIARHQEYISFDELFIGEDICYNHGSLISPEMMKEFLLPYYQQLYTNMKRRNGERTLHFQVDTDGFCEDVIPLYKSVGCDYMSPFEVAAHCDIVRVSQTYPDLLLSGGIDKRIIAEGGDALKRHLEAVVPVLRKRGGYIPTCDHGVPEEVSFENYMLYRELMDEYCG